METLYSSYRTAWENFYLNCDENVQLKLKKYTEQIETRYILYVLHKQLQLIQQQTIYLSDLMSFWLYV